MLYALYSLENRNIIEYGGVSMKIFIIEDEPAIREELVQLLQKYGYHPISLYISGQVMRM